MRRINWSLVVVWVIVLGIALPLLWLYQQHGFAAWTPGLRVP